jgi:hypothetical protein
LALLEIYLFFWGFVPLPLKLPCSFSFVAKKTRDYFSPLANKFVCLFVRYRNTERTPEELLTNAKRKEKNRKE